MQQTVKPEPAGASGWPPEIAKQRCLTCAAYAKWRIELEEGEATGGRNLCAVGMTKPSIKLSGASQAPVPAWTNWLVGEASAPGRQPLESESCVCCRRVPRLATAFQPEGGQALPTDFLYAEHVLPQKWG